MKKMYSFTIYFMNTVFNKVVEIDCFEGAEDYMTAWKLVAEHATEELQNYDKYWIISKIESNV